MEGTPLYVGRGQCRCARKGEGKDVDYVVEETGGLEQRAIINYGTINLWQPNAYINLGN